MSSPSETVIPSEESRKMIDNQSKAMLMNLPPEIILEVLSRLPIPTIVRCKYVCRQWYQLITSAAFADLHLARSTLCLIIDHFRLVDTNLCEMLEFVDDDEVEVRDHYSHYQRFIGLNGGRIIPNRNATIWIDGGSVNGLLFLVDLLDCNTFYICNPIRREYIALPEFQYAERAVWGFGVTSSSKEYKLVRISPAPVSATSSSGISSRNIPDLECVIYTLGTGSWRSVTVGAPFHLYGRPGHAFLRGNLHWLVGDAVGSSFIACFNLQTELFTSFPWIPVSIPFEGYGSVSVLGDCLCVCDCYPDEEFVVWVMKDYGVGESWTKQYVIGKHVEGLESMVGRGVWPLKVFKDGDVSLVWQGFNLFYYSSKTGAAQGVHLYSYRWSDYDRFMAMLHTPSLVSLKTFDKENFATF